MLISDKLKQHIETKDMSLYPSFEGKTMNIEITSRCNESCIYCQYAAKGFHKEHKVIDDEFFYRITKEAKELGISDVGLYITGEPLMNPKVYDYVRYLKKELGFRYVYISTNGVLCTPKNLVCLVEAGIDSIKYSVSSANRENFMKHHGIDAFNRVYENIKFAYNYRKENKLNYKLFIFSILTRYNIEEKQNILDTYGPYIDEIVFSNVLSSPFVKGVEEYLSVNEDDTLVGKMDKKKLPCIQLFDRIVVNEDGYLCACCHDTRTKLTQVDDLNDKSLKDAIYGESMINLRKRHLDKNIEGIVCENCIANTNKDVAPLNIAYKKDINNDMIDISNEIIKRFEIQ